MSVSYSYSLERKSQFEPDPKPDSLFPPIDQSNRIARLTGTYSWDTRDDPSNATRGFFHSSGIDYGSEALGSDLRFVRYLAQQYYFRRVGTNTILASALRVGLARGFGQDLLPAEKFYAGGGTSVRGFPERTIQGVDFFGLPIGGNGLLVLNQEVRFPIYRWFRGVGFFDAGNVFATTRDVSFGDLDAGTGLGLRIDSPFAIIRVDYGMPLSSREQQPRGRWYFAIGHTF
jgi:outer membrane protein assembly factor BamA